MSIDDGWTIRIERQVGDTIYSRMVKVSAVAEERAREDLVTARAKRVIAEIRRVSDRRESREG